MTKAEERALEAYPRDENDKELNYRRANYRIAYERGYEQALKDIGIVNELTAQQGIAIIEHLENHAGYQIINTLRFVGDDKDKPRPMPCRYYHVWIQPAKEEDL